MTKCEDTGNSHTPLLAAPAPTEQPPTESSGNSGELPPLPAYELVLIKQYMVGNYLSVYRGFQMQDYARAALAARQAPAEAAKPDELVKRLRIMAGMVTMGERITWGSDSSLMNEAASRIEALVARQSSDTLRDAAPEEAACAVSERAAPSDEIFVVNAVDATRDLKAS